ncbi:MAG: hypothetical protein CVU05_03710 [Bacteroidetes bacterium HGW-Bacteroidetes-21]|jgi:hypothetical protein|nr:MAG: hypothetical protein CVU05_03710 [Bacteroidetes bacterium HGW-Bacteroidetes-21]
MKTKIITLVLALGFFSSLMSQNQYGWVEFTDKKDCSFDPFTYFDARAIERRVLGGIPLSDSTDFPLNSNYVSRIGLLADSVMGYSRWFNALFVSATPTQVAEITQLPFVKAFVPWTTSTYMAESKSSSSDDNIYADLQFKQVNSLGGFAFDSAGIHGKGIRIAVFDGGFPSVDKHSAFKHIRDNNRIIKTWDFTSNKEYVYSYQMHGTSVLSCIAGMYEGKPVGLATEAEFLLARTEVVPEPFSEEKNWAMAAEWADKNGAQIINSSLGYTADRYFPSQMDGKFTYVTRAAQMAFRKGMLVVNAAGNEGTDQWKIIGAPADADSVLSIGGIDPESGYHTGFSSYGPTADKRMKPNVCAYGHVVAADKSAMHFTQGTSFASPLVAGFAACALQTKPGFTNKQLFEAIQKSASLYPYFDYAHGYGVPQASWFLNEKKTPETNNAFSVQITGPELHIKATEIYPEAEAQKNYLYFHFQDNNGFIQRYGVIQVFQENAFDLYDISQYKGMTFRAHYHGQTIEMLVK